MPNCCWPHTNIPSLEEETSDEYPERDVIGLPSDITAQMRQVIYGLLLITLMLYRPQGFLGRYQL